MDVDLSDLVDLEQQFYNIGYKDGEQHGRVHGLIEGRALGVEKGFEIWEEVGFYLGFASIWRCFLEAQSDSNSRSISHLTHLMEAIDAFPMSNAPDQQGSDVDISQLLNRIRARYKATCASLGVRPRLMPAGLPSASKDMVSIADGEDMDTGNVDEQSSGTKKPPVWSFTAVASKPGGLAF